MSKTRTPLFIGVFCAIIAAFGYGIVPVLAKFYYDSGDNVATFLLIRIVISFLIFMPIIAIMKRKPFLPRLSYFKILGLWNLARS